MKLTGGKSNLEEEIGYKGGDKFNPAHTGKWNLGVSIRG
jgi:hypothetical protein